MLWFDPAHYLAFLTAALIVAVIPGPTVMTVCGVGLAAGPRRALPVGLAVGLGDLTTASLSALGLGAVLAASAALFTAVKWLGAAYLVWMGIGMWRAKVAAEGLAAVAPASTGSYARKAYVVTALNPKTIVFLTAFMPQFLDSSRPSGPQLALYAVSFALIGVINATAWGLLAGRLRRFAQNAQALRWVNRCGGGLMIGAGVATALRD